MTSHTLVGVAAAIAVLIATRPWRSRGRRLLEGDLEVSPSPRGAPRSGAGVGPRPTAEWAADLSRELRGGATLATALRTTIPADIALAAATAPLRRDLEHGVDVSTALASGPDAEPNIDLVHRVAGACTTVGGAAAEPLDRAAATLRSRAADLEERNAQSAQARLSARVMTLLPLASLAFLATGDATIREVLRSPAGITCLVLGGLANALGWWWMRRIVRGHRWAR